MTRLEVKRSRSPGWKMPWPKQPYLRNGKAYELQTWCADGVQLSISSTCAVTSEVKVTPPLNAVTENPPYLFPKPQLQKAADLQIWPTDGVWWPISLTCGDLQAESSEWLFKSPLAGGGGMWRPYYIVASPLQATWLVFIMCVPLVTNAAVQWLQQWRNAFCSVATRLGRSK